MVTTKKSAKLRAEYDLKRMQLPMEKLEYRKRKAELKVLKLKIMSLESDGNHQG